MKYKIRPHHKPGKMNNLEREYANHLALLKAAGEILDFSFEPEKLKIAEGCYYIPDFRVIRLCPKNENESMLLGWCEKEKVFKEAREVFIDFVEVKAAWKVKNKPGQVKPHCEDDALVKLKCASELHPYKFIMTWKDNGKWEQREFN